MRKPAFNAAANAAKPPATTASPAASNSASQTTLGAKRHSAAPAPPAAHTASPPTSAAPSCAVISPAAALRWRRRWCAGVATPPPSDRSARLPPRSTRRPSLADGSCSHGSGAPPSPPATHGVPLDHVDVALEGLRNDKKCQYVFRIPERKVAASRRATGTSLTGTCLVRFFLVMMGHTKAEEPLVAVVAAIGPLK
jgi:hypothetical protein